VVYLLLTTYCLDVARATDPVRQAKFFLVIYVGAAGRDSLQINPRPALEELFELVLTLVAERHICRCSGSRVHQKELDCDLKRFEHLKQT
jgi:hypothetical protein